MTTGQILIDARAKNGKSLTEIANSIGIHKSALSRMENGRRAIPRKHLKSIASAYDLDESAINKILTNGVLDSAEDANVLDLVKIVSELRITTVTIADIKFLLNIRQQVGNPLSKSLVRELLSSRKSQ